MDNQVDQVLGISNSNRSSDSARHSSSNSSRMIIREEFESLLHPKEKSRFILAIVAVVPAILLLIFLTIFTQGIMLLILGLVAFSIWFALEMLKAALIGNAVRVSRHSFPRIYEILKEVKHLLNYHKEVKIFIQEESSVNAFLAKFFRARFIILNSDLVVAMQADDKQLRWIIGRFVGALRAKHYRSDYLTIILNMFEKLVFLNVLILPYERATQYSGDQIGLALCGNLDSAMKAFNSLLIGKDLTSKVSPREVLSQAQDIQMSFFGWLVRVFSTHPHMTDRYMNLMAFSRYKYPELYRNYLEQFGDVDQTQIGSLLPNTFPLPNIQSQREIPPDPERSEKIPDSTRNITEQIEQLAKLKEQGILTDAEFEEKKKDLLSRL